MPLDLTDEQQAIQEMARRFTAERITPFAADWDKEKRWPRALQQAAGALGLGGIYCQPDHGGAGLSRVEAALVFEQLAMGCPSTAAMISIHNMVVWMIDRFADEPLRARFVPSLASFRAMGSYCLTEPAAGSDAASLATKAERDRDHYILNGTKAFISGAGESDLYLVMARTGGPGAGGISAFVVEKDTPGLGFGAQEQKLGWHSQPTRMVLFDDCRIPSRNRIGGEGEGFGFAMQGLDGGRLNIAACSLGGAQRALDEAVAYVKDRRQFGQAIANFQAIRFILADMATGLAAARLMLYHAADRASRHPQEATAVVAMAKRFVTDTAFAVANQALQLHGGYGYLMDYPIERLVRDLRVHQILEGSNEIMRVVIARHLLKDDY